jgi:hypothetical protein
MREPAEGVVSYKPINTLQSSKVILASFANPNCTRP